MAAGATAMAITGTFAQANSAEDFVKGLITGIIINEIGRNGGNHEANGRGILTYCFYDHRRRSTILKCTDHHGRAVAVTTYHDPHRTLNETRCLQRRPNGRNCGFARANVAARLGLGG